jgi:thiol-disulfide isomerase/thioredoxin
MEKGQFLNRLLSLSLLFISGINGLENEEKEQKSDLKDGLHLETEDYKEGKNHSESIQRILRDFEKTLEDNKMMFDKPEEETEFENATLGSVPALREAEANSTEEISNSTTELAGPRARMLCNNSAPAASASPPEVLMLNGSHYQLLLAAEFNSSVANRSSAALCSLTLFFADWCDFSAAAAPHYNALARAFPQLQLYAVDSSRHHGLNTHYGVMAVPTLLVFHNSRPLYKYNYTEYSLDRFVEFVVLVTGLEAVNETVLEPADWAGPVPSEPVSTAHPHLWLALVFACLCGLAELGRTRAAGQLVAGLRAAWREAEIQHEHTD